MVEFRLFKYCLFREREIDGWIYRERWGEGTVSSTKRLCLSPFGTWLCSAARLGVSYESALWLVGQDFEVYLP